MSVLSGRLWRPLIVETKILKESSFLLEEIQNRLPFFNRIKQREIINHEGQCKTSVKNGQETAGTRIYGGDDFSKWGKVVTNFTTTSKL